MARASDLRIGRGFGIPNYVHPSWFVIFALITFSLATQFSYERATRLAARSGRLIAYAMIVFGSWHALTGDFIGGLWIAFIGWCLLTAAQESVAQAAVRTALAGLLASGVMSHEIPTVGRETSLDEYGQQVLRTGRRCHLVLSDGRLLGLMNVHAPNSVPREEWPGTSVQAAMVPRNKILWAAPDQPLLPLLERMLAADVNQVPVVTGIVDDASGSQVVGTDGLLSQVLRICRCGCADV